MSNVLTMLATLGAIISASWDVPFGGEIYTVTLALDEFDLIDQEFKGSVTIKRKVTTP